MREGVVERGDCIHDRDTAEARRSGVAEGAIPAATEARERLHQNEAAAGSRREARPGAAAEKGDDGDVEGGGEVHGAGIVAEEKS